MIDVLVQIRLRNRVREFLRTQRGPEVTVDITACVEISRQSRLISPNRLGIPKEVSLLHSVSRGLPTAIVTLHFGEIISAIYPLNRTQGWQRELRELPDAFARPERL